MTYQEKCAEKFGHLHANTSGPSRGPKESLKPLKDREASGSTATDSKSLKHKKHRKKKRDDGDPFSHSDSMDETRKDDRKGDSMLMNSSRDDATPVRDEPMDNAAVPYKSTPEKEKKEKSKSKTDKVKRKSESSGGKKEIPGKVTKPVKEKEADALREKVAPAEPAIKRVKDEPSSHKSEASKPQTVDSKLMLPRKLMQSRPIKHHQELKPIKDDLKNRKEFVKEPLKQDKVPIKDVKVKKEPEKPVRTDEKISTKAVDSKQDKKMTKRKDEKSSMKDLDAPPIKIAKMEVEVAKGSPKPKPRSESERPAEEKKPAIPSLLDIKPEPVRKIKINREIGKRIPSTDRPFSPEDITHTTAKGRVDKSRGKLRRKVHAPDGSGSVLVDYTR